MGNIRTHKDLQVYQSAFQIAVEIHQISMPFPPEEKYSLTDQIRRSSRSVCANLGEAFRKRRYPKSFIAKLSDSEAEASETQIWWTLRWSSNTSTMKNTLYSWINMIISSRN